MFQAMAIMRPYISERRMRKMEEVLERRCLDVMFLYERPVNPSNVYACLRTMDAFGVQNCCILDGGYTSTLSTSGDPTGGEVRKKKNRKSKHSAMGSDKWLTVDRVNTGERGVEEVVEKLKKEGYTIYASSLEGGPKVCIVFGNEESGVSPRLKSLSEGLFYLPMSGFAESYNLSVATSLTLAYLQSKGVVGRTEGWEEERREIMCRWMIGCFPKKGMGEIILEKEGIDVVRAGGGGK
ncbi:hypothetical protein TrRE_jg1913 [Triparma retinervis]|uniref:tRNA/rRNA methyltransferase SpoU type domain-containing protein n=1 Tax=Triparma retinervis TaxID=2557542 RepID=A0A9W7ADV2_9STRA|nr:hypothetical protein TrRE_jg1913 [Triparma retinervis]